MCSTHHLKKKNFSPPIVENALPTVNRSATNRGAVKRPKPLEGDQPPAVDVKAKYGHDVMCCRPDHLSFCERNHSSQADHSAVVGFACMGCRYQLFFWDAPQPGDHPKELS